jgi:hypothetical protein
MKYTVYALVTLWVCTILAGCGNVPTLPTSTPIQVDPKAVYTSVYIAPHIDEAMVPNETLIRYRIKFVPLGDNLAAALHNVDAIYLHPDAVGQVDPAIIQAAYQKGATVVAIDTLLSDLSTLLDKAPPFDDLRPMQEGITMAMYYHTYNRTTQDPRGSGVHAEYYDSFDRFPSAVNELLRRNGKDPNR